MDDRSRPEGWQISPDHARAIADTGGSVGTWRFFPSLDKYVDLKEMTEIRCERTRQLVLPVATLMSPEPAPSATPDRPCRPD